MQIPVRFPVKLTVQSVVNPLRFSGVAEDAATLFKAIPEGQDAAKSMNELEQELGWTWMRRMQAKKAFTPEQQTQIRSFQVYLDPSNLKNVVYRYYRL